MLFSFHTFCKHMAIGYGQEQLDPDKSKEDKAVARENAKRWYLIAGQFK